MYDNLIVFPSEMYKPWAADIHFGPHRPDQNSKVKNIINVLFENLLL